VFPALVVVWTTRKRWRRLGLLLAAALVLALVFAAVFYVLDSRRLAPDERYLWTGGHILFLANLGAIIAGNLTILVLVLEWIVGLLRGFRVRRAA
jgi:hypothetical protein